MARACYLARHLNLILVLLTGVAGASAPFAQEIRRIPVAVAAAEEHPVLRVLKLAGTVTSEKAAALSVATSGLVMSIAVDAGHRVSAGDLLLALDSELARFQWQSAEADVSRARQALVDARRRLEEARRLAPQQSIAETAVRDLESEVAEDDAALQRAIALAGYQKGILDRHRLFAPFPGVISRRLIDVGEWVTPGDAVLELVSTDRLRLDFQVSEDYLGRVGSDARIDFYLAGNPQQRHAGRIIASVPVTDPTARTFLLRVVASEPVSGMLPGMSVNADLILDAGRRGISVPRDAVLRYSDGRTVIWVVESKDGADRVSERLVQSGLTYDGRVEITSGLRSGERVVVEGNEALRNGQPVAITESEAR